MRDASRDVIGHERIKRSVYARGVLSTQFETVARFVRKLNGRYAVGHPDGPRGFIDRDVASPIHVGHILASLLDGGRTECARRIEIVRFAVKLAVLDERRNEIGLVVGKNVKALVDLRRNRKRTAAGEIELIRLDDRCGRSARAFLDERHVRDIKTAACKRKFVVVV